MILRHRVILAVAVSAMALATAQHLAHATRCDPIFNPCNNHAYLPIALRPPTPTATPIPTATPTPEPYKPFYLHGEDVIAAFRRAGLQAEDVEVNPPRGLVPDVCKIFRFHVPRYVDGGGGRVFECADGDERQIIFDYYADVCSWVPPGWCPYIFQRGNILVQLAGPDDIPPDYAARYGEVLDGLNP
jgi:hypothetical protein